jgi:hypothetical protein
LHEANQDEVNEVARELGRLYQSTGLEMLHSGTHEYAVPNVVVHHLAVK